MAAEAAKSEGMASGMPAAAATLPDVAIGLSADADMSIGAERLLLDESLTVEALRAASGLDGSDDDEAEGRGGSGAAASAEGVMDADEQLIKEALGRGESLRDYASAVEAELQEVENASIEAYIREDTNLRDLHKDIRSCSDILGEMETMLSGFHAELSAKSEEISELQTQSLSLNLKLKNRRALEERLGTLIDQMVIPPELVQQVFSAPLDGGDVYFEVLATLRTKLQFLAAAQQQQQQQQQPGGGAEDGGAPTASMEQAKSFHEMAKDAAVLKAKAVARVREWLLAKINTLKKPGTNVQIIQRDVLLRHRPYYEFLREVSPTVSAEVSRQGVSIAAVRFG
jgi:hypothetical protein